MLRKLASIFLLLLLVSSCSTSLKIIDKPIIFDEERKHLTLEYMSSRYNIQQKEPTIEPVMIVLHWTVIPTLQESYQAFYNSKLPSWRPDIKNVSGLNVSAHFIVDRDGTIYRLLPENIMARHVIGLNHCAIGIENVGGNNNLPLTKAQLKSNINLVEYLSKKYTIEYVIGHYEYTNFENHPLWLENDSSYRTVKDDPGKDFTLKVRAGTKKYNFKPIPNN